MPDLIAQGPHREHRWRRSLPAASSGRQIVIGRTSGDWHVPWDPLISRAHVRLTAESGDRLMVQCLAQARNPLFHQGAQVQQCVLVPGDHFVIGKTTFTLTGKLSAANWPVGGEVTEHLYDRAELSRRDFRDVATRIELLARLPDLISGSASEDELLVRVTSLLRQATPQAAVIAIVAATPELAGEASPELAGEASPEVQVLHSDTRGAGLSEAALDQPPLSESLIRSAVTHRQSVLHLWTGLRGPAASFTAAEGIDWAFCVPLRGDASCPGWAIYISGQLLGPAQSPLDHSLAAAPNDLQDDVKFTELVGTLLANFRQSLRLERRQTAMRRFFAPVVLAALAERNTDEVLGPREADVSVMFCDLRDFTRSSEQDADQLLALLQRVSDALGVMTGHILDSGGVIGDFHGDAAMGFWGWPLDQPDGAIRAAQTALQIKLSNDRRDPADRFDSGIGIATGRAVAGRIGTVDQVKVTAFGPVVNLASRLEGMTKFFGVGIIVDDATRVAIESAFPLRPLAPVRPAGIDRPIEIHQLLPQQIDDANPWTDHQLDRYRQALESFIAGRWEQARDFLTGLPSADRPSQVLQEFMERNGHTPPADWTGAIDVPKL